MKHRDLIYEASPEGYRQSRRIVRALRTLATNESDREIIGGMISDCDYSLSWMETGRRPGSRRGIERRAAYEREKLVDPLTIQSYVSASKSGSLSSLSDSQRDKLEEALSTLSNRERECYEMAHGQGFTHANIGDMLGISRATVSYHSSEAQKKISRYLASTQANAR